MVFISAAVIGTGMAAGAWLIGESLVEITVGMALIGGTGGLCARSLLSLIAR